MLNASELKNVLKDFKSKMEGINQSIIYLHCQKSTQVGGDELTYRSPSLQSPSCFERKTNLILEKKTAQSNLKSCKILSVV